MSERQTIASDMGHAIRESFEDQLEKLNRGKPVVTYEMVRVGPSRDAQIGAIRYIVPWVPNPAEPMAQMLPCYPIRIVWNGVKWIIETNGILVP